MKSELPGNSLLGRLQQVRDARRREGKTSRPLGFTGQAHVPSYGAVRVFYVRDVSYGEDRSHARLVGGVMSAIRNLAISIIRTADYPFMTDAWAEISARPDLGFSLLLK